jgi:hypothetical protein
LLGALEVSEINLPTVPITTRIIDGDDDMRHTIRRLLMESIGSQENGDVADVKLA